ncbi:MAG: helix-turn-helix domain-containing protein, partial [Coprococcus phoceensis]
VLPTRMGIVEILTELSKAICLLIIYSYSNKIYLLILFRCVIIVLLDECILLLSQMKGVLIVISDTQNAQSPTKNKKTYTVEEIAEQLDISKKVAYSLVKSGQFSYVRAGKAIRVSKVSFDKWLNGI